MPFDTLITNATVLDGTGSRRYRADVRMNGGEIEAPGSDGKHMGARPGRVLRNGQV